MEGYVGWDGSMMDQRFAWYIFLRRNRNDKKQWHTDRDHTRSNPHTIRSTKEISSLNIVLFFCSCWKKDEERSCHAWSDTGRVDGGSEDNPFLNRRLYRNFSEKEWNVISVSLLHWLYIFYWTSIGIALIFVSVLSIISIICQYQP